MKAYRHNPHDVEIVYGLASSLALLEHLHRHLHPQAATTAYNPLPYFRKAVELRPYGITYCQGLLSYLADRGKNTDAAAVIEKLTHMAPQTYSRLRRKPFWNDEFTTAAARGLQLAAGEGIRPRDALTALADYAASQNDWDRAIAHYHQALTFRAFSNRPGDFIRLGRFYAANRQHEEARNLFLNGLKLSQQKNHDLNSVYHYYRKLAQPEEFERFYLQLQRNLTPTAEMAIPFARCLMDQRRFNQAQRVLTEMVQREALPEGYYWLARIAQKQEDWDEMELAAQRAAFLAPRESRYHQLFSVALSRKRKYDRAEQAAESALRFSPKQNPWLFNHRAWVRWNRKNYHGAIQDWRQVLKQKPQHAATYFQIAESYRRLGMKSLARKHYLTARKLDPQDKRIPQRLETLKQQTAPARPKVEA